MTEKDQDFSHIEQTKTSPAKTTPGELVLSAQQDTAEKSQTILSLDEAQERENCTVSTRVYMLEHLPIRQDEEGQRFRNLKELRKNDLPLPQEDLEALDQRVGTDSTLLSDHVRTNHARIFSPTSKVVLLEPAEETGDQQTKVRVRETFDYLCATYQPKTQPAPQPLRAKKLLEKADSHADTFAQVAAYVQALEEIIRQGTNTNQSIVFVGNKSFSGYLFEKGEILPPFLKNASDVVEHQLLQDGYFFIDYNGRGEKMKPGTRLLVTPANFEQVRTFLEQVLPEVGVDKDIITTQNKLNDHLVTEKFHHPEKYRELLFKLLASEVPQFRSYALRAIFTITEEPLPEKMLNQIADNYETKQLSLLEQDMLLRLLKIAQGQHKQVQLLITRLFIEHLKQWESPELLHNLFRHHGKQKWLKLLQHNQHTHDTVDNIQRRSLDPEIKQHVHNAILPRKWSVQKEVVTNWPQSESLEECLQSSNMHTLEESVGFGKSMWLIALAQQLLVQHPDHAVVMIDASSLNDKNPEEAKRVIQTTIKRAQRVGKPVVLVDALDELTSRLQSLQEFVLDLPYPKFITTRPGILRNARDPGTKDKNKNKVEFIRVDSLSVDAFIRQKGKTVEPQIRKFLEENPLGTDIQNSPLILHMICILAQGLPNISTDLGILPLDQIHNLSSLYENFLKLVIVEHERSKGKDDIRNREQLEELFDYLSELAQGLTLGKSYTQIQKEQKWSANDKVALEKINILLNKPYEGNVQFTHESILEYFLYRYSIQRNTGDWDALILHMDREIPNELPSAQGFEKTASLLAVPYHEFLSNVRSKLLQTQAFNSNADFYTTANRLVPQAPVEVLSDICSVTGQLRDPAGIDLLQKIYNRSLTDGQNLPSFESFHILSGVAENVRRLDLRAILSSPERESFLTWLQHWPQHPAFYTSAQADYFDLAEKYQLQDELFPELDFEHPQFDWYTLFRITKNISKDQAYQLIDLFVSAPQSVQENKSNLWWFLEFLSSYPDIPNVTHILEQLIPLYAAQEQKDAAKRGTDTSGQSESVAEQFYICLSRISDHISIPASFLEKILTITNDLTGHNVHGDSVDGFIMAAEKLEPARSFALLARIFKHSPEIVHDSITSSLYIHALGKTQHPEAIELIDRLYQTMSPDEQEKCLWAYVRSLGCIGGSRVVALLSKLEPPTNPSYANIYISAVGNSGSPEGVPLLRKIERTPVETSEMHNTETVTILADALGRLPGPDAHLFLNEIENDINQHPLPHTFAPRSYVHTHVSAPTDSMYYTLALAYARHHDGPKSLQYLEKYLSYSKTKLPFPDLACLSIMKGNDPDFLQFQSSPEFARLVRESRQAFLQTIHLLVNKHPRMAALGYLQLEMLPETVDCLRNHLEMELTNYLQNQEYTSPFDRTLENIARDEYFQPILSSPGFQALITEFQDRFNAIPEEDKPACPNGTWLTEEPFDFG